MTGLLNVLEVNYDKLYAYRKDTLVMPEMQTVQTLQKMDGLYDLSCEITSIHYYQKTNPATLTPTLCNSRSKLIRTF